MTQTAMPQASSNHAANAALDKKLRARLQQIPEIVAAGYSVREGLSGDGVTILRGRNYFGSWRLSMGKLVWVSANTATPHEPVENIDEAARRTLLLILRDLQAQATRSVEKLKQAV